MAGLVFISAKSEDYAYARRVFDFLKARDVPCFFADPSLLDNGRTAYRRVIDEALEASVHMIVVTSSREHVLSDWVEYEWGFFQNELLSRRKQGNLLTILCGDIFPGVLPPGLRTYQSLRLDEDLDRLPFFLPGMAQKTTAATVDSSLQSLGAGQLIAGRFRLEGILGKGGMGAVWKARDQELRKTRALKFLNDDVAADLAAVALLKDELGRCQELNHPHIIRVFELVKDPERSLVAVSMEVASGGSITARRLEKPYRWFEPEEIFPWVEQICAALTYIHEEARLVHRDLKPANLLLDERSRIKLSDFGISSAVTESRTRLGVEERVSGTIAFMSPEQASGKAPHPSDDLYALGATIYELLTGRPPFGGSREAILSQLLSETAPLSIAARRLMLEKQDAPIPERWEEVIAALLAKTAAERPASAREVMERLGARSATEISQSPTARTENRGLSGNGALVAVGGQTEILTGWSPPPVTEADSAPPSAPIPQAAPSTPPQIQEEPAAQPAPKSESKGEFQVALKKRDLALIGVIAVLALLLVTGLAIWSTTHKPGPAAPPSVTPLPATPPPATPQPETPPPATPQPPTPAPATPLPATPWPVTPPPSTPTPFPVTPSPATPVVFPSMLFPAPQPMVNGARGFAVQMLISREINAWVSNDIGGIIACYSSPVDYFDEGHKTSVMLRHDLEIYRRTWPIYQARLTGPIKVSATGDPNVATASYSYAFLVSNPQNRKESGGVAHEEVTVRFIGDRAVIIRCRETITNRHKNY